MGAEAQLIGRDVPLRALMAALDGDRSTVVVGEAGVGKTTLVRVAAASAERRIWEGGGFATLTWMPRLALQQAVGTSLVGDIARVASLVEGAVGPDLLFIDDLQWVDDESLAALRLLAARMTLVVAVRSGDAGTQRAMDLARACRMRTLGLEGLSIADATDLARRLRPELGPAAARRLASRSAGNPLLLEELVERGDASPVLARALTGRYDRLPPRARRVVELLAVAEQPLRLDGLGAGVHAAMAAGVVVADDGVGRIRHEVLAEAVRQRLSSARRRSRHATLAALVDQPAARAAHLAAAGRRADASRIAAVALGATSDLRERAALLRLVAESSGPADYARRVEAARAFDELSDWPAVDGLLAPTPRGQREVAVARCTLLARSAHAQGRIDAARGLLASTAPSALNGGSSARVEWTIEMARFEVNVDGDVASALARLDDEIVAAPDALPAIRDLRAAIVLLASGHGDLDSLQAACDAALEAGAPRSATELARAVTYALLMHRGADEAHAWAEGRRVAFSAARMTSVALLSQAEAVQCLVLAGRYADAVREADEILEQAAPLRARQAAALARARALSELGQLDAAARTIEAVRDDLTSDFFGAGEAAAIEAEIALWSGRPDRAIERTEVALGFASPVPGGDLGRQLVGDWARFEAGRPIGSPPPVPAVPSLAGGGPEAAGLRLLADGNAREAATDLARAATLWERFNAPRAELCRWAAGEATRVAGDRTSAVATLRAVLADAEAAGAEPIAARARRSLRQAGVRLTGTRRTGRPSQPLQLTRREAELVDLVREGLTNAEIARRLGLGRPTVARMLASAMDKCGFERRTQLAASVAAS